MSRPDWLSIASVLLCLSALALLVRGRKAVAETMLMAPWRWACAALVVQLVSVALLTSHGASAFRYLADLWLLTSNMALLGAKRPQSRAWQWIVLALIAVLALPALENMSLGSGESFELHPLFRVLLLAPAVLAWLNYLPSRQWIAASLVVTGQMTLLAEFVVARLTSPGTERAVGLGLLLLGILAATLRSKRSNVIPAGQDSALEQVWSDFWSLYGAMWSLRVAERFNDAAQSGHWPIRLAWNGRLARVDASDASAPHLWQPAAQRALVAILKRFVSDRWLAARLPNE